MAGKKQEVVETQVQTVVKRTASDVAAEYSDIDKQIKALTERKDELKAQLVNFIKAPTTQAVSEAGKSLTKPLPNGLTLVLTFSNKRAANQTFLATLAPEVQIRLSKPDITAIQAFYKNEPEMLEKAAPVTSVTESLSVKAAAKV